MAKQKTKKELLERIKKLQAENKLLFEENDRLNDCRRRADKELIGFEKVAREGIVECEEKERQLDIANAKFEAAKEIIFELWKNKKQ